MMKVIKMNQNHPPKVTIQEHLKNLGVVMQLPQTLTQDGCKVNLEGFKHDQNSFVVDVDKEIEKKNSEVECKGKRCDLVLCANNKDCVLIEVKRGQARNSAREQLLNTREWFKKQKNISPKMTYYLVLIAESITPYQLRSKRFQKAGILHIKHGKDIFKYLKDRLKNN